MKPKAVIFDLDGTLINSIEVYHEALNEIFRRVGLPQVGREEVKRALKLGKNPWDIFIPHDIGRREELIERCKIIDREIFWDIWKEKADLFPASREVLLWLKEKGVLLGVVTSGWDEKGEISEFLKKKGVYHLIDVIIKRFDVPKMKPSPEPIIECCKRLGIAPEESVYVGDTPGDIQAAKAAGAKSVGVLTGTGSFDDLSAAKPDVIIETIHEFTKLFEI